MRIEGLGKRRYWKAIGLSAAVMLAVLVLTPLVGSTRVDFGRVLAQQSPDYQVMVMLRVPRVLLAMIVGGVLALAGTVFQSLLRDALADPYTLGVSSGASLGAVTAICFGWQQLSVWATAVCGAGAVMVLVLGVAGIGQRTSSLTLLLAGIAINSICSALILFVHSMAGLSQSFSIVHWLMGGISPPEYSTLGWLLLVIVPAVAVIIWRGAAWNLMTIGEEWAAARGVSVKSMMLTGYIAGSVLTASVTALTGPIGFVGLIVPHALRMRIGADHRLLLPCSFLLGAAFLAICDALARVVLSPVDVPVSIITSLLGGPFFIWLLRTRWKGAWR